jgi:hypothetical protein
VALGSNPSTAKTNKQKKPIFAGSQWLTPAILATQEAEIRRIMVRNQPRQIVCETLSQKYLTQKTVLTSIIYLKSI